MLSKYILGGWLDIEKTLLNFRSLFSKQECVASKFSNFALFEFTA